jgi:FXSXX-COOH protein
VASVSAGIESHQPDMTGLSLDVIREVGGPELRRALLRLCREAAGSPPRYSGFSSNIRPAGPQVAWAEPDNGS